MRGSASIALSFLLAIVSTARADEPAERFPYSGFVASDEASVRSGPSEAFYPVLTLRQGDAVEVWRHDPGGWCAIRPPEGAFSWIAAEFVEVVGERTGVIRGNQVNVRVGTHFSDMRDAVQVKLDEGETVDLIERRTLTSAGQATTWFKIHPPAGEFRWIHIRQLVRHPDELPRPGDVVNGDASTTREVQQASFGDEAAMTGEGLLPLRKPNDLLADLETLPSDAPTEEVLSQLETTLSRMVAAEPTAWSFAELQRRGEAALETAADAGQRGQARMFLGKLARFQDIQARYAEIAHLRNETAEVDRQLGGTSPSYAVVQASATEPVVETPAQPNLMPSPTPAAPVALAAAPEKPLVEQARIDTARYDASGRLQQVAGGGTATAYALVDGQGRITAYVAAAPGVNLRPYLDQDVGINGIRGYLPDKQTVQLTAKRIDVLR
ncbi:MAG: SH3 domain-containing protein [Planctomycetales bacterium]|nr:SH3 domain-containing protein [Planctomycetales bacterium]MBN8625510.1 SH3 domain-containing protein [Planctomycetota bacterium]